MGLVETIVVVGILIVPSIAVAMFRLRYKGAAIMGCVLTATANLLVARYEEKSILQDGLPELLGRTLGIVVGGMLLGLIWYCPVLLWRRKRAREGS